MALSLASSIPPPASPNRSPHTASLCGRAARWGARTGYFDSFRSTVARSRDFLRSLLERPSVGGSPSCRPLMRETIEVRITDQTIIKLFHAGVCVAAHTQPAAAPAYDDCRAHAERASPSRRVDADRAAARSRGGRPGHHRLGGAHPHRLAVSGAGVPSPPWNPAFGARLRPRAPGGGLPARHGHRRPLLWVGATHPARWPRPGLPT